MDSRGVRGGMCAARPGFVANGRWLWWLILVLPVVRGGSAYAASPSAGAVATAERPSSLVTLRDLLETATLSGVAVSPNSRFVSVRVERRNIEKNAVALEWYILRLPGGNVIARTSGGEPDWHPTGLYARGAPVWSADSQWIYFRALRAGRVALWRLGVNGRAETVISSSADVDGFMLDRMRRRILYWVGPSLDAIQKAKRDEYRRGVMLRATGSQDFMMALEDNLPYREGITTVRWTQFANELEELPLGDSGARTEMSYDMGSGATSTVTPGRPEPYRYDFESDSLRPIENVRGVGAVISRARDSRTGDVAFISIRVPAVRDRFGQIASPYRLGVVRPGSGKAIWCTDPRCQHLTGGVVWRPGTDEFIFLTLGRRGNADTSSLNGGQLDMYSWNADRLTLRRIMHSTGQIGPATGLYVLSQQCPVTQAFAICVIERAAAPPKLVRVSLEDGGQTPLFDPNARLRQLISAAGIPEHLKYMGWKDGRGLFHTGVYLSARTNTTRRPPPLVITSYDCLGFLQGGTGATTPEFVLWEDGFAVLCTNIDGALMAPSYRSGQVPSGQATRMEYMFDAWRSAVALLANQSLVDRKRVGISGLSFTGETVNYVITHHPRFARAAAAGHLGLSDPIGFYIEGGIGGEHEKSIVEGYGWLDPRRRDGSRYYRIVSNALNAQRICAPILVQTDEAEFRNSVQYYGAMRLDRVPAEVIVFPRESHVFWQPRHLFLVEERNIAWFRFWLEHYEPSDTGSEDRIARWRKMRENAPVCRSAP